MPVLPAARVGDDIAHSNAGLGMGLGMSLGVVLGAALIIAATGGTALVVAGAVGGAMALTSAGGLGGMYIGEASMGAPCGKFVTGSTDVFVNGRPATFTFGSAAACSKDGGAPQPLATGAAAVIINFGMAGRRDEKVACSAKSVPQVSPNVFIGGPSAQDSRVEITPEVPEWAVTGLKVLGLAGAVLAFPYSVALLGWGGAIGGAALGFAGSTGMAMGARALGEAMGLSESTIRAMEVGGGFIGGMLGGAAGVRGGRAGQARFDNWRARRAMPPADRVPRGVPMSQAEFNRIRALPQTARPENPRSYLGDRYVDRHLDRFDEGGSYLTPTSVLDRRGRDMLGRPDGVFVMPKREMDALMNRTGGNIGAIERELGIPPGAWDKPGATLSRIDVPNPRDLGLRMPNGREDGANPLWMPGGKLPGGGSEAVVNQIPKGSYLETLVRPGR